MSQVNDEFEGEALPQDVRWRAFEEDTQCQPGLHTHTCNTCPHTYEHTHAYCTHIQTPHEIVSNLGAWLGLMERAKILVSKGAGLKPWLFKQGIWPVLHQSLVKHHFPGILSTLHQTVV